MHGGGLLQLVAYGAQDLFLTEQPQITFFKNTYRRHTNFAIDDIGKVKQPYYITKDLINQLNTAMLTITNLYLLELREYSYSNPYNNLDVVDSSIECAICLGIESHSILKIKTKCGHILHRRCLQNAKTDTCPICHINALTGEIVKNTALY